MAEKGEKRDPSSHRTPGQIKRMNKEYDSLPRKIKQRAMNNAARKELGLKKGDKRDANHIKPVREGGTNAKGNLNAVHRSINRGWDDPKKDKVLRKK